jgi:hypothetical protein
MLPSLLEGLKITSSDDATNATTHNSKDVIAGRISADPVPSRSTPHQSAVAAGQEGGSSQKPSDSEIYGRPQQQSRPLSASSFEFGELLGEGSYSRVLKAKNLNSGEICAIKVWDLHEVGGGPHVMCLACHNG